MILAAGLGTRLRPLTNRKPKALVPVANQPALSRVVEYLKRHGVTEIIVNAHHHYKQIVDFVDQGRPFEIPMEVRIEKKILGTGGGIRNTLDFWNHEAFVVINSDILTDIDLLQAVEAHRRSGDIATLVLHKYKPFNQIALREGNKIRTIGRHSHPECFAFTGIHIVEPPLLQNIPGNQYFDIIQCYRQFLEAGTPINGFLSEGHRWWDIGSLESYRSANREVARSEIVVDQGCEIHPSSKFSGWAVIGKKVTLEARTVIHQSILWDGVIVKAGMHVSNSIITNSRTIDRPYSGEVF
jgi:mannose-1-phosphate guanylyltransferase